MTPSLAAGNGSEWLDVPSDSVPTAAAVLGPQDVWTVDESSQSARHWDGSDWRETPLPATATALDANDPDDIWAVGFGDTTDEDDSTLNQPAAMHWDGARWRTEETPEYRFPEPSPPEETASLDEVVTVSPTEAWAWGVHTFNHGEVADEPATEDFLLRWDGSQWKEWQAEPDEVRPGMLASDGAGGLVTDGQHLTSDNELLSLEDPEPVAGRAGMIEKVDREQRLSLNEVVHVSDTDQVWGVGHVGLEAHGDANFRRSVVVSYSTP